MIGGGGGSILDMINRFRDNRAMLGRRKIRFKSKRRFFDEKPFMTAQKKETSVSAATSVQQLEEIRLQLRKDAVINRFISAFVILICFGMLVWIILKIIT